MGIRIISTGAYLPSRIETVQAQASPSSKANRELATLFSGAREHRVCQDFEIPAYMGIQAGRNALANGDIDPKSIDVVLCYSAIEDHITPKGVYAMLSEIGCDGAMAWSIDTACASFLSHLNCANALALTGKKRFLIIESMNWANRAFDHEEKVSGPGSLVGDGAGAAIVDAVSGRGSIIDSVEKTSTLDFDFIKMNSAQVTGNREYLVFTKSHKIIHRAFSILPQTAQELLDKNGLRQADITWTFTHQPGITAIQKWHEMVGMSVEKNLNTFLMYGNMFAANIPITLNHYLTVEPRIKRGDIILAFTAGAGIHCAATLIEY